MLYRLYKRLPSSGEYQQILISQPLRSHKVSKQCVFHLLWYLADVSAAVLLSHLPSFKAINFHIQFYGKPLRDFAFGYWNKTLSSMLTHWSPGNAVANAMHWVAPSTIYVASNRFALLYLIKTKLYCVSARHWFVLWSICLWGSQSSSLRSLMIRGTIPKEPFFMNENWQGSV